ncbi:MAG: hypothetical protein LUC90_09475 [Lachnospiraceae bacterium]|nr:hypothetical protein [Lachnospiraceae bacterium]
MFHKRKSAFVLALIIVLLLYFVPIPVYISKTVPGTCFTLESDYTEQVSISIKGFYLKYLIKEDVFAGNLTASNLSLTNERMLKCTLYKYPSSERKNSVRYGTVTYYSSTENEIILLGYVMEKDTFSSLLIQYTGDDGKMYIAAPAEDYDSAISIYNDF